MARNSWSYLFLAAVLVGCAHAQPCAPGTAILKLVGMDPVCQSSSSAIPECAGKMQLTVGQQCSVQLQPDLAVATDGTFCSPSQGMQQRDMIGGKFSLGRSDVDFLLRPHAATGVILMNMKGRIVPAGGGREYPLDCNLMYNVTGGSALGIVSTGRDSLMATSFQGPLNPSAQAGGAMAGGGYSGAGMLPGQQNGLPTGKTEAAPAKSSAGEVAVSGLSKLLAAAAAGLGLLLPAVL